MINWKSEQRPLSSLEPWEQNPRQLKDTQADHLQISLDRFGLALPFLISPDGELYDGHQRQKVLEIMEQYGPDSMVDCRVSERPLTHDERRELVIRLHENTGEWNFDELANVYEVEELTAWGFPDWKLPELGDPDPEEEKDAEPQISRADELKAEWGTELAQLWQLGEHRLICGDCTDAATVERLMDGALVDLMVTDPPYGVSYDGIENDDISGLPLLLDSAFSLADTILRPGGVYYICHPDIHSYEFAHAIRSVGWKQARPLVVLWLKDTPVMGRGDYNSGFEMMFYGWKGTGHYFAGKIWSNVWQFDRPKVSGSHTTMKPVGLFENAIRNSSQQRNNIYEPFSGSGTTIIAAQNLNRRCYAIEISPAYVAVALQRFKDAFGIDPVLIS